MDKEFRKTNRNFIIILLLAFYFIQGRNSTDLEKLNIIHFESQEQEEQYYSFCIYDSYNHDKQESSEEEKSDENSSSSNQKTSNNGGFFSGVISN